MWENVQKETVTVGGIEYAALSGWTYGLIGPALGIHGAISGKMDVLPRERTPDTAPGPVKTDSESR